MQRKPNTAFLHTSELRNTWWLATNICQTHDQFSDWEIIPFVSPFQTVVVINSVRDILRP